MSLIIVLVAAAAAAVAAAAAAAPQGCMDGGEKKIEKKWCIFDASTFRTFSCVFGRFRPFSDVFEPS